MNMQNWINEWLENYVKPTVRLQTYNCYSGLVATHIIPTLGRIELNDLTALDIQKFITSLKKCGNLKTGQGLSSNYINGIINIVQGSLKTAFDLGIISQNFTGKIRRPKAAEKRVECFSLDEQRQIEKAVLNHKKKKMRGIILCLYTGLRIGELLALQWDDIDFEKGYIKVTKSAHDCKIENEYERVIDVPKSPTSNRIIPIPSQILSFLSAWKTESACDFLIADGTKPTFVRSYQSSFSTLLKKLGIPHKGFHSLRHTFATRALECGMDVKTLSEILGHKNATITLNRYVHSLYEHKVEMMRKIGSLYEFHKL